MKKFLAILMTLALMLSCVVGLTVSSSAAELEYVEESYKWAEAAEADYASHTADDDGNLEGGQAFFADGLWTLEWFDTETSVFSPMSAYFAKAQEGWVHGGWSNFYTANVDSVWSKIGATYCSVASTGKRMHPGDTTGSVITFNVPATGVISYNASIAPYGTHTSDSDNGGDAIYLYVNDTMVWPANADDAVFYSDTVSKDAPMVVDCPSFNVNAGDKVRLVLTTKPGTTNGSKGCDLVQLPVVTYHSAKTSTGAEMSVGNPKGEPPTEIITSDATAEGCKVTWVEAKNAAGYNIYIDGQKVNAEPITALEYVITGLQPKTNYNLTITTVTTKGSESDPSPEQPFRTKKGEVTDVPSSDSTVDVITDTTTDTGDASVDTTPVTSAPATTDDAVKNEGSSSVLWIVIAAVAAAVVIAAVVVVIIIKKKKAQ